MSSAANPITSVAPPSSSPITSVQPQQYPSYNTQPNAHQLSRLHLDVRGSRFVVERERLMSLPESVLLCLFPNGLVLSRPPGGRLAEGADQQDVYVVDFSPNCFNYVLDFFQKATLDFYGTPSQPGFYQLQQSLTDPSSSGSNSLPSSPSSFDDDPTSNPLLHKQGIIVLREELEYFVIPAKGGDARTDGEGMANESLRELKFAAGQGLLERKQIFTALQRNVNKENNVAEQHLIDMLCQSGFDRTDEWGYRDVEPNRCLISSLALVLLKTGIRHPTKPGESATVDQNEMATAQKLLLFWRKPARKCWWDGVIDLPVSDGANSIKVWARRVWTLELNLI